MVQETLSSAHCRTVFCDKYKEIWFWQIFGEIHKRIIIIKKCQHICDYVNPMTTKSCMGCLVFQINYSRTSITNLPYSSVLCLQVRMWILCFWAKKVKINLKKNQDYSCFAVCARRHLFLCMKIDPRLYIDYGLLISKQKIAQYILHMSFPQSFWDISKSFMKVHRFSHESFTSALLR